MTTFPMTSHPLRRQPSDADLRKELTFLENLLAEHMAQRPGWWNINARKAWVETKDFIQTDIDMVRSQLVNRWRPVERP